MKKQTTNGFTEMSKSTLENLVKEVPETLARVVNHSSQKTFTIVDLWNIQRHRRVLTARWQRA